MSMEDLRILLETGDSPLLTRMLQRLREQGFDVAELEHQISAILQARQKADMDTSKVRPDQNWEMGKQ